MSTNRNDRETFRAIRARARQLGQASDQGQVMTDAEVLAAWRDGSLSFDDIPDDVLARLIQRVGGASAARMLTRTSDEVPAVESDQTTLASTENDRGLDVFYIQDEKKKLVAGPKSWWSHQGRWLAAAASVAFVTTVVYKLIPSQLPEVVPPAPVAPVPPSLHVQWPSTPPFNPQQFTAWATPRATLPTAMPDFKRAGGTLGATSGEDQFLHWREATVIVRTDEGWGSGSIVSADGWILTTYQVVQMAAQRAALEGEAARVQVIVGQQGDGSITPQPALEGTLYRADPIHDLALLKLAKLPPGRKTIPYFKLATDIKVDEDCYVIGSQQQGLGWWLRAGNVSKIFNYPKDQKQVGRNRTTRAPTVDRITATVVATDIRNSPGDSGGPLLNAQGELAGITRALPANYRGGSASWHIALSHLQAFLERLPDQPEGVPFDVWTMGNPQATLLTPHLVDADGDARIDTLQMPYSVVRQAKGNPTVSEPIALAALIDFTQRSVSTEDDRRRIPTGLWGMEQRGQFQFDLVIGMRADGVVITGYTGSNGELDEIRIAKGNAEQASLLWEKEPDGRWRATKPTEAVKLFDPAKIGEANAQWVVSRMDRLMNIRGFDSDEKPAGSREQQ